MFNFIINIITCKKIAYKEINYIESGVIMILKKEYNYRLISKDIFDSKMLEVKTFNDVYRKYKIIKYKKDEEIFFEEIIFEDLVKKFENIIKIYEAEKIISSCTGFDERYEDLTYYHIEDLYFIEFKNDDLGNNNQNDLINEKLKIKGII